MQRRFNIVFDTKESGGVYIDNDKDTTEINILLDGDGSEERRLECRRLLRMYDLGAQHKAAEIRKVLGVG